MGEPWGPRVRKDAGTAQTGRGTGASAQRSRGWGAGKPGGVPAGMKGGREGNLVSPRASEPEASDATDTDREVWMRRVSPLIAAGRAGRTCAGDH